MHTYTHPYSTETCTWSRLYSHTLTVGYIHTRKPRNTQLTTHTHSLSDEMVERWLWSWSVNSDGSRTSVCVCVCVCVHKHQCVSINMCVNSVCSIHTYNIMCESN